MFSAGYLLLTVGTYWSVAFSRDPNFNLTLTVIGDDNSHIFAARNENNNVEPLSTDTDYDGFLVQLNYQAEKSETVDKSKQI